jgi:hypothetical protein
VHGIRRDIEAGCIGSHQPGARLEQQSGHRDGDVSAVSPEQYDAGRRGWEEPQLLQELVETSRLRGFARVAPRGKKWRGASTWVPVCDPRRIPVTS